MTFWPPLSRVASGLGLSFALLASQAQPADALLGVGANVGAAVQFANNLGPAADLDASVSFFGPSVMLRYWQPFDNSQHLFNAGLRYNVSPIPMVTISPGVSALLLNGGVGGQASLDAAFRPLLFPFALEGNVGAGYVNGSMLLPYGVGVKLSLIPFTSINVRYRGWTGAALNTGGPELGLEIGL